jgi:hypothetical protein
MTIQDMEDVERGKTHGTLYPEVGILRDSKLIESTQDDTIFVAVDHASISSCVVGRVEVQDVLVPDRREVS